MSGVSIDLSHPRPCSGRKTLRRRFSNLDDEDDLILIDVDSEMSDNVVIIDVPESLPRKTKSSSRLRKEDDWSFKNVIYIDDDDDDEISECHSPIGVKNSNSSFGVISSRQSYPYAKKSACSLNKECQYVPENVKPVRISKCKRTYSGKGPTSNRYGLNIDSASESSDSDCEDCEIIDDSSGKVQEQWEKAFSRRANVHCEPSNTRDHYSTSGAVNEDHPNNLHHNISDTLGKSGTQVNSSPSVFDVHEDPIEFGQRSFSDHIDERRDKPSSSKSACEEQFVEKFDHPIPEFHETIPDVEICPSTSELYDDFFHSEHTQDEPTIRRCQNIFESMDAPCMFFPTEDKYFEEENRTGNVKESEIFKQEQPKVNGGEKAMDNSASELSLSERNHISSKNISVLRDDMNNGCHQESSPISSKIALSGSVLVDEANLLQEGNEDRLQLCTPNDLSFPSIESSVISEREKLKETEEYKKALEEEWASRRQALQIQAEEAQRQRRLLKRKKAEKLRLLDMERRQKQRIEEVRNTQKKDEENMNLKVEIQTKVREKLKNLEVQCHSMATLLYLLGINITGWPNPSQQAVQAAYKRALLTFHPDRASQSDLSRQVEAEETFKLINRLKEKFSSSL